jgi:thiamine biosynthesis lipoprotein
MNRTVQRPRRRAPQPEFVRYIVIVVLAVASLLTGCEKHRPAIQLTGVTMGTQYSITIVNPGETQQEALETSVDALLGSINAAMSTYDPESELSLMNQNSSTEWIKISDSLHTVLQAAIAVAEASGGAFDVTVGPLVNLWGFGPDRGASVVPDPSAVANASEQVGTDKFEIKANPSALRKRHPEVYIDLSGIAKGYAVDRLARFLQEQGYEDFLVDIGGELRAAGLNPNRRAWRIGIENPTAEGREIGQTIVLTNTGLASSGNYRNYFESDGVRYGHTIDPKTGAPTQHRLASVTVLHSTAMLADAWATALMSMGFGAGLKVANEHELAALFFVAEADNWNSHATRAYDIAVGSN